MLGLMSKFSIFFRIHSSRSSSPKPLNWLIQRVLIQIASLTRLANHSKSTTAAVPRMQLRSLQKHPRGQQSLAGRDAVLLRSVAFRMAAVALLRSRAWQHVSSVPESRIKKGARESYHIVLQASGWEGAVCLGMGLFCVILDIGMNNGGSGRFWSMCESLQPRYSRDRNTPT